MRRVYNAGLMKRALLVLALAAACATPPPPAPTPAPEPQPTAPAPPAQTEPVIGHVKVSASMLNVRAEASTASDVVAHVRRGERLDVLTDNGEWLRVRAGGGEVGWVSAQHVAREGALAAPRGRRGCPPDQDFRFIIEPKPTFSDSSTAHGIVTVEANVDAKGDVKSTKLVSNTTGDPALGTLTEREIAAAKFAPPVRNCAPKAFIYTYRRSF